MSRVLLLHGLWLRGFTLAPLRARLRAASLQAHSLDYASVLSSPREQIVRLERAIRALPGDGPVHLLGHSLGGLLSIECARAYPELPIGRILCLGSPLTGSSTAAGVAARGPLGRVLGKSVHLLRQGALPLPEGFQIGMIAGTLQLGFGRWFTRFEGPHDGTVSVAETRAEGLADHLQLRVSHTGLIYSREVARQAAQFLLHGRFDRRSDGPS
ncbi:alpha/beta fold hydrolase [Aquimonas sp.]|jgi:pimeloyl-ACP methyl ester carboxylesterase|uniref:alpha/beta fold hydrolase n=1 Tax=Aquimonas sp. TaxID=1872588 RepID=UPI0037BFAAD7